MMTTQQRPAATGNEEGKTMKEREMGRSEARIKAGLMRMNGWSEATPVKCLGVRRSTVTDEEQEYEYWIVRASKQPYRTLKEDGQVN